MGKSEKGREIPQVDLSAVSLNLITGRCQSVTCIFRLSGEKRGPDLDLQLDLATLVYIVHSSTPLCPFLAED